MKIALVWPESTFLIDPMVYPPLALWFIKSALIRAGYGVDFYDLGGDLNVPWDRYDQVWFSGTTPQAYRLRYWGLYLRERYHVKTVLGGPHAAMHAQEMLEYFDVVVTGEVNNRNVRQVVHAGPGLLELGLTQNMFDFPVPSRGDATRYKAELRGRPCTSTITSLGCPFSCAFCASNWLYGSKVRYLIADRVLSDIETCKEVGFTAMQFYDDILPILPDRTMGIAEFLYYCGFIWRCFMRSDLGLRNGYGFLRELADCGLVEVLVGVESGSNVIKKNIHKGTTVEQDTEFRRWCKDLGITYKASIILGLPGETMETMTMTQNWLLENKPDRVDVNVLIPLPGTPIVDNAQAYDCRILVEHSDEYFYKGHPEEVVAVCETAALTPREIDVFRADLLSKLRAMNISY